MPYRQLAILSLVLVCAGSGAQAATFRSDREGFTQDALHLAQAAAPGVRIEITGPLTLSIGPPGPQRLQASLDRIYDYCQRVPDDCEAQLTVYVRAMAHAGTPPPADAALLRAVLRPKVYRDGLEASVAGRPDAAVPSRPFAGDLVEMCVVDRPDTAQMLNAGLLKKLGLDEAAAFARCEANVAAALPLTGAIAGEQRSGHVAALGGDYYESSLPLLHDAWKPIAARSGVLLVAIPDSNTLVYADSGDAETVATLGRIVADVLAHAQRQLSPRIYRWTPAGWDDATP